MSAVRWGSVRLGLINLENWTLKKPRGDSPSSDANGKYHLFNYLVPIRQILY